MPPRAVEAHTHNDRAYRSSAPAAVLHASQGSVGTPVATDREGVMPRTRNRTWLLQHPPLMRVLLSSSAVTRLLEFFFSADTHQQATPTYVLPAGEWWVAAQVGWYDVRRQWSGTDATLEQALNASKPGPRRSVLVRWSGAPGVQYWPLDRWRSTSARNKRSATWIVGPGLIGEITTSVVTLDTQVFVSNLDTITTTTFDERLAEGMDERSVLRIPIEGHWRGSWRRWSYGVGLGWPPSSPRRPVTGCWCRMDPTDTSPPPRHKAVNFATAIPRCSSASLQPTWAISCTSTGPCESTLHICTA